MGTFNHRLKANKTGQFPRNWCFVDTETKEVKIDEDTKKQVLRLGTAIYSRDAVVGKKRRRQLWDFTDASGFWEPLLQMAEQDRRLIVLAYNVGFDSRILDMFSYLPSMGYEIVNLFDKGQVFISVFKKGVHKIQILDAMNFFTGKLEEWGKVLGVPKGKVDFETVTDKELLEYCYNDVAILEGIWERWRKFVRVHDLGCFSPTKSSQALSAFRHRFMDTPIFIHANKYATRLERDSYYGGRNECFRMGELRGGPFYKVDVNSMYPYIMKHAAVPVRLRQCTTRINVPKLRRLSKRYALVAEVVLETDIPAYPFRRLDGLIYPVGRFRMTLAGPELIFALQRGHIKSVKTVAIYDAALIFRRYINEVYGWRNEYKANKNKIFEQLCKYLLNCLYGKFAQRNEVWRKLKRITDTEDGVYFFPEDSLVSGRTLRIVAGSVFQLMGVKDSMHSFHAISSYITSAARMYLWELIEKAGRKHVFYTDTDSLIVDKIGFKRLDSVLDSEKLGMLKVESITKLLRINAPKDYQFGNEVHVKGVSSQYTRKKKGVYSGWQWEGIRGAIRNGNTNCVVMKRRTKILRRDCRKGILQSSGSVSPFVLDGETAFSRCSMRRS